MTDSPTETAETTIGDARRFAAVVPIGPTPIELLRAVLLFESLVQWESSIGWCVFVDDTPHRLLSAAFFAPPSSCRVVVLLNPRQGRGDGHDGGLCAGLLRALAWIATETTADFTLKIDTDALVVAPFAEIVRRKLTTRPSVGMLGVVGPSCNPAVRARHKLNAESMLARSHRLLPKTVPLESLTADEVETVGLPRPELRHLRAFDRIRSRVERAVENGYSLDEYCQGGAYVISSLLVQRMAADRYFDDYDAWTDLGTGEDRMMGMYARAAGLNLYDCSSDGDPFGIQFAGLPYPPEELLRRGFSIVHSIKNDRQFSESAIRAYFRNESAKRGSRNDAGSKSVVDGL